MRQQDLFPVESVSQVAQRWDTSARNITRWCRQGKVPGAYQLGDADEVKRRPWVIPRDAKKPEEASADRAAPLKRKAKAK